MIICENPKFILFSVNKTGTSSMDDALTPYFDEEKYRKNLAESPAIRFPSNPGEKKINEGIRQVPWNVMPRLKHAPPDWIRGQWETICPEIAWSEFYKVCFVRNPFDRLLSIYSFHTQVLHEQFPKAVKAGSFEAWLRLGGTGAARHSMKKFVQNQEGNLLLDFVGRYESIRQDWETFLNQAGIPSIELGHNPNTASKHAGWEEVYTPGLKELVMSNPVWRDDLEYFGYV